jgi:hypothetical protein
MRSASLAPKGASRLKNASSNTVNISGAVLDTNPENDGWFDLEVWGRRQQIVLGLKYLKELGLQIWL